MDPTAYNRVCPVGHSQTKLVRAMVSTRGNIISQEALERCRSVFLECHNDFGVLLAFSEWEPRMLNPAVFCTNLHKNCLTNGSVVGRHWVRRLKAENSSFIQQIFLKHLLCAGHSLRC